MVGRESILITYLQVNYVFQFSNLFVTFPRLREGKIFSPLVLYQIDKFLLQILSILGVGFWVWGRAISFSTVPFCVFTKIPYFELYKIYLSLPESK